MNMVKIYVVVENKEDSWPEEFYSYEEAKNFGDEYCQENGYIIEEHNSCC